MSKVAASVHIYDAPKMTPKGRKEIVKWLRRQATLLDKYNKKLDSKFRAEYYYG